MAESGENAGVRNAHIALQFFRGEGGAAVKQVPIRPRREADIGEEQLFTQGHAKSIYAVSTGRKLLPGFGF